MTLKACPVLLIALAVACGCQKPVEPAVASTPPPRPQAGGAEIITPDVGAVSPVTSVSLDSAAGGGINSAAMKKAKKVAGEGVGSVNSAQKNGEAMGDDGG